MKLTRRIVPQSQYELDSALNVQASGADLVLIEGKPLTEDTPTIAISIISNSRLLTGGLISLLSPHLSLEMVGIYSGELRVNSPLPNPQGHVVLLDSNMGHSMAIAWTRYWRGLNSPAYVLILELANDNALVLACIEAGASGYTLQGASALEVAEAIKDARGGVAHCSPEVTAQLFARVASLTATAIQRSLSPLTTRESEILRYIATGHTNLEIAAQLVIELRTVKQHVHHILRKLHARTRGEASRLAADQGWLGGNTATPL